MDDPFDEHNLKYCDHPSELWDGKIMRRIYRQEVTDWLAQRKWLVFLTLTFKNETEPEIALKLVKELIRKLNECVYGEHYLNYVDHSYFSYMIGIEFQKRGVIHFHILIDRPVNFLVIHTFWNSRAGFADPQLIRDSINSVYYVTKYCAKSGEIEPPFFAKKLYDPPYKPIWWKEQEMDDSANNDQDNILP